MSDTGAAVTERRRGALKSFLDPASWVCLGLAAAAAVTVLVSHWGVNAASLGQYNAGLAIFFSFAGGAALVVSFYAVPVFALAGLVSLFLQRFSALRFFAAAVVAALPFAVLSWLGQ